MTGAATSASPALAGVGAPSSWIMDMAPITEEVWGWFGWQTVRMGVVFSGFPPASAQGKSREEGKGWDDMWALWGPLVSGGKR